MILQYVSYPLFDFSYSYTCPCLQVLCNVLYQVLVSYQVLCQVILHHQVLCQVLCPILLPNQVLCQVLCQALLPPQVLCKVLWQATILVVPCLLLKLLVMRHPSQPFQVVPANTMQQLFSEAKNNTETKSPGT